MIMFEQNIKHSGGSGLGLLDGLHISNENGIFPESQTGSPSLLSTSESLIGKEKQGEA